LREFVTIPYGNGYSHIETNYGFVTQGNGDNTVWYFQVQKPTEPPPIKDICRFYQLEPLLEKKKAGQVPSLATMAGDKTQPTRNAGWE
jgi:hypothetical protein